MSILDFIKSDDPDNPTRLGRRRLLLTGSAAAIGAALIAACGDDDDTTGGTGGTSGSGATTASTTGTTMGSDAPATTMSPSGDLAIAQLAAGLEVLAVSTYQQALDAAGSGALGDVPPAVAEYVTTALAQHEEHLAAWNEVITGAGEAEVTEPNADLAPVVDDEFAKVTDVAGAAELALMLEAIAAQTYLAAIPMLAEPAAIKLAGSIQIVDQQHQSILLFALGQYPVPDVFQKTDQSAA